MKNRIPCFPSLSPSSGVTLFHSFSWIFVLIAIFLNHMCKWLHLDFSVLGIGFPLVLALVEDENLALFHCTYLPPCTTVHICIHQWYYCFQLIVFPHQWITSLFHSYVTFIPMEGIMQLTLSLVMWLLGQWHVSGTAICHFWSEA